MPYPYALDHPLDASPELILLWSRRTILYLEIESFDDIFKQIDDNEEMSDQDKEQYKEEMAKVKQGAQEELEVVVKKFDEIQQMVLTTKEDYLKQQQDEQSSKTQAEPED